MSYRIIKLQADYLDFIVYKSWVVNKYITRSSAVAERPRDARVVDKSLKVIRNDTVEQGACKSLLVFHWNYVCRTVYDTFSVKKWRDLETRGRGRSRLLKTAPFDRPYATLVGHCNYNSVWCHFRVIWRWIISWLEIGLRGHSRSLKLVPFESLGAVSYSPSIVTMAVSVAVCELFSVKAWHCDHGNWVIARVVQGH